MNDFLNKTFIKTRVPVVGGGCEQTNGRRRAQSVDCQRLAATFRLTHRFTFASFGYHSKFATAHSSTSESFYTSGVRRNKNT